MKTGIKNATDVAESKSILQGLVPGVKLQSAKVRAGSFHGSSQGSVQRV